MAETHEARQPWDRRPKETARAYLAFRAFRDLGPLRTLPDVPGFTVDSVRNWSKRFDWYERAASWDDEQHRIDDSRRLEALRSMHDTHQRAARMAMSKAIEALMQLQPDEIPAYAAARLLELGARLERETLTISVEELQGVATLALDGEDPWDRIARDFQASQ